MLGITVVSFLLLPLFLHFQTARTGAKRNAHSLTATSLATAQIEKLRRLTYRRVETILLTHGTIQAVEREDIRWPNILSGPFEDRPERPDIIEEEAYLEGKLRYQRLTYLSYFPDPNPNPDSLAFNEARRRIRIRVVVKWREFLSGKRTSPRSFELSTMIQDEGYSPKPSLRRLVAP
jgi:hypothetical protein